MTHAGARSGEAAPARWGAAAVWFGGAVAVLAVLVGWSITIGAADIGAATVWQALTAFDDTSTGHQVVVNMRLPRAVVSVLVGGCLAVAGALIQGVSRNPLASPSLLGVNAGAAFALALAFALYGGGSLHGLMLASMAGAGLGIVAVYAIGALAPGGLSPVRLVLAGAAVAAVLGGLTTGLVVYHDVYRDLLFFQAGGVAGTRWIHVRTLLPWAVAGLGASLWLARSVAALHLGEETAVALGVAVGRVRVYATLTVVVLAGAAVAVAGPVGFVGLITPHLVRLLLGSDDRLVIPASIAGGAVLVAAADIGTRLLHPVQEVPLGMVTALAGVPFFLWLVGRRPERHA